MFSFALVQGKNEIRFILDLLSFVCGAASAAPLFERMDSIVSAFGGTPAPADA